MTAGATILVVDDNAENRALARATLEGAGFKVALASDGDDGIHGIFTLIVGNFCEAVAGPDGLSPDGGGDDASTGTVPSPDMLFALCMGDAAPGLPWPPPAPPGLKGLPA